MTGHLLLSGLLLSGLALCLSRAQQSAAGNRTGCLALLCGLLAFWVLMAGVVAWAVTGR